MYMYTLFMCMTIHIKKLDMFECTALIHIKKDVALFMCTIMNIEQQQVMCSIYAYAYDPLLYQR